MLRWWRRLVSAPPPSTYLFRHLDDTRNSYDLDDLTSGHDGDPAYQDVIDAVFDMMSRHDQALASAAARTELRRLAMRLASQGR